MKKRTTIGLATMMMGVMIAMLFTTTVEAKEVTPSEILLIPEEYNEHYEGNLEVITKEVQEPGVCMKENGELETVYLTVELPVLVYKVQPKDTLSEIAVYFQIPMEELLKMNPEITNPDLIFVEQNIILFY